MEKYKILIYGAGVIGSILAVNFSKNGNDVHVYARNDRLEILKEKGLLYEEKGKVVRAEVTVDSNVSDNEHYDFYFCYGAKKSDTQCSFRAQKQYLLKYCYDGK